WPSRGACPPARSAALRVGGCAPAPAATARLRARQIAAALLLDYSRNAIQSPTRSARATVFPLRPHRESAGFARWLILRWPAAASRCRPTAHGSRHSARRPPAWRVLIRAPRILCFRRRTAEPSRGGRTDRRSRESLARLPH